MSANAKSVSKVGELEEMVELVHEAEGECNEIWLDYHDKRISYKDAKERIEELSIKAENAKSTIIITSLEDPDGGTNVAFLMYYLEIRDITNYIKSLRDEIIEIAAERDEIRNAPKD